MSCVPARSSFLALSSSEARYVASSVFLPLEALLTLIQETEQGSVDLPEDEPAIVKLMMQYIYEGEYDPVLPDNELSGSTKVTTLPIPTSTPHQGKGQVKSSHTVDSKTPQLFPHTCEAYDKYDSYYFTHDVCRHHVCGRDCDFTCRGFTCEECRSGPTLSIPDLSIQLMVHAKLYEIADKYDVVGLKELVIEKFKRACHSFWNDPSFAAAAHHVFSTTPEHDKGLRDIVSKTIAEHMAELVKKPEVEALLTEFNGLAFGLLKMKTEAGWK